MKVARIPHPGRILLDEYMVPFEISQNELARTLEVSPRRINEIVLGKRAITADTALRLETIFGKPALYWMTLQAEYDLDQALLAPEARHKKLPAPKRTRAQRRHDAFRYEPQQGVKVDDVE